MSWSAKGRLPIELILLIIESLVAEDRDTVAYRSSHPITQTLVSLTLTSHATYPSAIRLLHSHCLYIDSSHRLRSLLNSITGPQIPSLSWRHADGTPRYSITSLYLAPFDRGSIDDQPTARWVQELFFRVAPTLKRLVIDIPLRSLYPLEDHLGVRPILRAGFEALVNLEEFLDVQDELYLDLQDRGENSPNVDEVTVWTTWPMLRRLGLYNADCVTEFWRKVARMPRLETVVLTRPDGLEEADIKAELLLQLGPAKKVLIVNTAPHHLTRLLGEELQTWPEIDREERVKVMQYFVPTTSFTMSYPGHIHDHISLCQDWVRDGAIRGDIWDWEGVLLPSRT